MKYVILIHSNPQPWGHPTGDYVAEVQALPKEEREKLDTDFEKLLGELHLRRTAAETDPHRWAGKQAIASQQA